MCVCECVCVCVCVCTYIGNNILFKVLIFYNLQFMNLCHN